VQNHIKPWTNISSEGETWAEFSTLDVMLAYAIQMHSLDYRGHHSKGVAIYITTDVNLQQKRLFK
jgi:hypothetical protein